MYISGKKHNSVLLCILFLLILPSVVSADLSLRAPDVLPGTLPEMRDPSYWIARMDDPDEVIMTPGEIARRNRLYVEKMSRDEPFAGVHEGRVPMDWQVYRWPCRFLVKPDVYAMSPAERSALVKEKIAECNAFIREKEYGNYMGVTYAGHELDRFAQETALDEVPNAVTPREGIAVRSTRLRVIPTLFPNQVGFQTNETGGNYSTDLWCSNVVKIGRPVAILHRSRTGSHLFVLTDDNFGWVDVADIAFAGSGDTERFTSPEQFIVCTGRRVPFYSDAQCTNFIGWLRMGDRMPKAGPRQITVPYRNVDGSLEITTAWLPEHADVHDGYIPYTRRNIIETAFKMLDEPYDWTGSTLGWNHVTIFRDIFACFGFRLPFNAALFTHFGDKDTAAMPDDAPETKWSMIMDIEPFVSFAVSRGHALLYLGKYDGHPVAFDISGYGYSDGDGKRFEVKRAAVSDMSIVFYLFKYPITFLELN